MTSKRQNKENKQNYHEDKRGTTKVLREKNENVSVNRVMLRAGNLSSVSITTVCRTIRKSGIKWSHSQKKRSADRI